MASIYRVKEEREEGEIQSSTPPVQMEMEVPPEDDVPTAVFSSILKELSLSEVDINRRQAFLLSFPNDLMRLEERKEIKKLEDVVLFPFGSFYHGIGIKDETITAFVGTGKLIVQGDLEESGGHDDTDDLRKNLQKRKTFSLLLDINNALGRGVAFSTEEGEYEYKNVSLTHDGKLSFTHKVDDQPSDLRCIIEAKSFLPVQFARLVKFYWILDKRFWPFTQMLVQWAGCNNIIKVSSASSDTDGFKVDHMILLAIFFLVRKRVIPSFYLLHKWADSQFIVDGINVAFCEDGEKVHQKCLALGIGCEEISRKDMLERTVQLLCEFFLELSTFDFFEYGISPATGTAFPKHLDQRHYVQGKRKFDTNSMICIQDMFDNCQNTTRKMDETLGNKLKERCKETGEIMLSFLWNGNLTNAILSIVDKGREELETCTTPENPVLNTISVNENLCQLARAIRFQVPGSITKLLTRTYFDLFGSDDDCESQIMRLSFKILQEFNGKFWKNLVGAKTIFPNQDPVIFPTLLSVSPLLKSKTGIEDKVRTLFHSVLSVFEDETDECCKSNQDLIFYVQEDWTKSPKIAHPLTKKRAFDLTNALLQECPISPVRVFGARPGPPPKPELLLSTKLALIEEKKGWYLYTYLRPYNNLSSVKKSMVERFLDWYSTLAKDYVIRKFENWFGKEVLEELRKDSGKIGQKNASLQKRNVSVSLSPTNSWEANSCDEESEAEEDLTITIPRTENVEMDIPSPSPPAKPKAQTPLQSQFENGSAGSGVGVGGRRGIGIRMSSLETLRGPRNHPYRYVNPAMYTQRGCPNTIWRPPIHVRLGLGRGRGGGRGRRGRGRAHMY